MAGYELEEHHVKTLTVAAESWDRGQEAREALAKHGLTYLDRYGCPKTRPECRIEATSKQLYMRAVRELGLDIATPEELSRPPATTGRGRR